MSVTKQIIEDMISEALVEQEQRPNLNQHPEVKDLRSKGYSVYVSKVHRDDPHTIHEVEKNGHEVVVIHHAGDGKYRLRTGAFGGLSKKAYDTLHSAVKSGMAVKNTKKYKNISTMY